MTRKQQIYTVSILRRAVSGFSDKIYLKKCRIHGINYGDFQLEEIKQSGDICDICSPTPRGARRLQVRKELEQRIIKQERQRLDLTRGESGAEAAV